MRRRNWRIDAPDRFQDRRLVRSAILPPGAYREIVAEEASLFGLLAASLASFPAGSGGVDKGVVARGAVHQASRSCWRGWRSDEHRRAEQDAGDDEADDARALKHRFAPLSSRMDLPEIRVVQGAGLEERSLHVNTM